MYTKKEVSQDMAKISSIL